MYTYDVSAADMFEDRSHQFEKFGIPLDDIERVRGQQNTALPLRHACPQMMLQR